MRGRRRLTTLIGAGMVSVGSVLLLGVGSFYAYGFYSATKLDGLNVSSSAPLALPSGEAPATSNATSDAPYSGAQAVSEPGNAVEGLSGQIFSAEYQSPTDAAPSTGGVKIQPPGPVTEQPVAEAQAGPGRAAFPVSSYAAAYPVQYVHPKYWGQPRWAGTDGYSYGQSSRPDGLVALSPAEGFPRGSRADATRIVIPAIGVDSVVKGLAIIEKNGRREYETPKHLVGHIPTTAAPGEAGNVWLFGHLESPLLGEGNIFHRLPEVPRLLTAGDPVYVTLHSADGEFLYQIVSSRVVTREELGLFDTDDATITLVTCANPPLYDHRQLVTAKLVGYKPAGQSG